MTLKEFEIYVRDRLDEFVESYKLKHSKYPEAYQIENIIHQWYDMFDDMFLDDRYDNYYHVEE